MATTLSETNHNGRDGSFDEWSWNLEGSDNYAEATTLVNPATTTTAASTTTTASGEEVMILENIPKQLHPAVSMSMRRVSSCYFSVRSEEGSNSVTDLFSLFDEDLNGNNVDAATSTGEWKQEQVHDDDNADSIVRQGTFSASEASSWSSSSSDLLYHDILMNVFTFLDAPSLSAVSETARRLNFEVFYFLGLQLQRALIPDRHRNNNNNTTTTAPRANQSENTNVDDDSGLSCIAGVSMIRRLACLNRPQAEGLVKEFLDSNASLRHMPLSHSLTYMRQVFRNHAAAHFPPATPSSQAALASAALVVTLLGAASQFQMPEVMMASMNNMMSTSATEMIPNMLFRVGFVGSLMKAAKSMTETSPERLREMKLQAERMAARLQETVRNGVLPTPPHGDENDTTTAAAGGAAAGGGGGAVVKFPSWSELMRMACSAAYGEKNNQVKDGGCLLLSHDPYSHLSAENDEDDETKKNLQKKTPTGCIGAYLRTVHKANKGITDIVRQSRRQRSAQFSDIEREALSRQLLESCANDSLERVKAIVHNGVDVDGFYVGADGSETCALHTAAFNGSALVIEFLCSGIDDSESGGTDDGGLCDVNRRDDNAWSALHFAAGSNSVEAVRILIKHGADWTVEANNGYTPLQWAMRLQHHQVAQELKNLALQHHELQNRKWMAHRPLSAIASRFFALVMVQTRRN